MYEDLTANEKQALLEIVKECLSMCPSASRPLEALEDGYPIPLTNVVVLFDTDLNEHEASGTYGSLARKGAIFIDKEHGDCNPEAWTDIVEEDVFEWAEEHWDSFLSTSVN